MKKYYHVCQKWDGGDLLPLAKRVGECDAIDQFCERWDTEDASFAAAHVWKVFLYDNLDDAIGHQLDYGGEILAIDEEPGLGIPLTLSVDPIEGYLCCDMVDAARITRM